MTLFDIVDQFRRGELTHNKAARRLRALGRYLIGRQEGTTAHDRRNIDAFLAKVIEHPVEQWPEAFSFWLHSVESDAPWIVWLDPQAVN